MVTKNTNVAVIPQIKLVPKKIKSAAYVRVSRKGFIQEESFIFQKQHWEEYLSEKPNQEFVGIYSDTMSGHYEKKRKGFMALIEDALAGKIDVIYTKSVTRFCRNMPLMIETLRKLADKGVAVIFEKEGINSLNPKQNLVLQLQAITAEQEIKNNKALVEKSRKTQFAAGKPYMCVMPYGYSQAHRPNFVIDDEESKHIRLIFEMYLAGKGLRKIVAHLNSLGFTTRKGMPWATATVYRILKNEKYVGDVWMQKTFRDENHKHHQNHGEVKSYYIDNNHEGIISRADWDAVQEKIQANAGTFSNRFTESTHRMDNSFYENSRRKIKDRVVCGLCGANYTLIKDGSSNGKRYYYYCSRARLSACTAKPIPQKLLDGLVEKESAGYTPNIKNIGKLESKLKEVLKEQAGLLELKAGRYITLESYEKEYANLSNELKRIDDLLRNQAGKGGDNSIVDSVQINEQEIIIKFSDGGQKICKR